MSPSKRTPPPYLLKRRDPTKLPPSSFHWKRRPSVTAADIYEGYKQPAAKYHGAHIFYVFSAPHSATEANYEYL